MKILKKINKGLILTILVLIAITLYYNNLEKQRDKDKPEIIRTCEEFIQITNKYSYLPEDMQESQKEEYINQMKKELEKVMIDNQEDVNIQQQILENNLSNTKQERKIQKVKSYKFEENQVTVSLNDKVEITSEIVNNSFEAKEDEIILQKVNGKWKVVYSNLLFNGNTGYIDNEMARVY